MCWSCLSVHIHFIFFPPWQKKKKEFTQILGWSLHVSTSRTENNTAVFAEGELPAVMDTDRQTGTNWHEWAWQQAFCGWRRGERLLSMCPCLWIMRSTFSKAHGQKCQSGSATAWAHIHQSPLLYTNTHPTLLRLNRTHVQRTPEPVQYSAIIQTNKFHRQTLTNTKAPRSTGVCMLPSSIPACEAKICVMKRIEFNVAYKSIHPSIHVTLHTMENSCALSSRSPRRE